uniref:phosphoribosyltransferase n=1 Tax=Dialister sp. TaxID=1955814 RepID=UPI00402785A6
MTKILCHELVGHCALVAVPPSKVQKNGKTAVHTLIKRIMASVDSQKEITDASSCLVCCNDSDEFHNSPHLRSPEQVYQNIEVVNPELIQGKDVLLIDDILTSATSVTRRKKYMEE